MRDTKKAGRRNRSEETAEAADDIENGSEAMEELARVQEEGARQFERTAREGARRFDAMTRDQAGGINEAAEATRRGVEAMVECSGMLTRGFQEIGSETARFSQETISKLIDTTAQAMACRSLPDLVALQSNYARQAMADFLEESVRLSEMTARLASEALGSFETERPGGGERERAASGRPGNGRGGGRRGGEEEQRQQA